jgi:hypothetical protein
MRHRITPVWGAPSRLRNWRRAPSYWAPRSLRQFDVYIMGDMAPYAVTLSVLTTIRVAPATRDRLSALKSTPRETYDELLNKLLSLVPSGDDEGRYKDAFQTGLLSAHLDIRAGRLTDHDQVKRRLGL